MDSEATALENALAALRRAYGDRLPGAQQETEARMRHTVERALTLDELAADRVVKKLAQTGRLAYVGSADTGTEPGTSTTGPVLSLPAAPGVSAGTPVITTADPALVMGTVRDPGGGDVAASELGAAASDAALTGAGARSGDPIRGGEVGRRVAENNEGASMGQLADTNVEAAPAPITIGEREEMEDDRTHGYWRIG
jgi:hypothetical protein